MQDIHEPRSEFIERLAWQVGLEVRRRNRAAQAPQWTPRSRMKAILAVLALMVASMGIGAAVVAAAYEAQADQRRDQLTSGFEQRAELARQRLAIASGELPEIERRVSIGVAPRSAALEGRIKVADAEAQVKSIELQLEEVRITAREPRNELNSPLVSGRDFVTSRLRIEMSVPEMAVELARARLREAESRFAVGMANVADVDVSRVRVLEVDVALEAFRRKIEIRQKFLKGEMDAIETELRVLECEAEQRRKIAEPKAELARKDAERATKKFEVGIAQQVEVTEAALRRLELQTELAKADLDLALVRRRIEQHRAGR
jgi:outer membrane protein TolC